MNRRIAVLALAVLALSACGPVAPSVVVPHTGTTTAAPASLAVVPYSAPPRVTGTWPAGAVCRAHGALPDPACTPGSVASVERAAVCATGFEATKRPSGTDVAKTKVMAVYGVPTGDKSRTELDHLVPLSLGGSNDVTNLWPEVSDIPSAGFRNSKDDVERKLLAAVCKGGHVPLTEAQIAIAQDWTTALRKLGIS